MKDRREYQKQYRANMSEEQKLRYWPHRTLPHKKREKGWLKHTEETKSVLSKKALERFKIPEDNPMYGKTHTEETIKQMKNSHKNKEKVFCPNCKIYLTKAMYMRWHFNKCVSQDI